MGITVSLVPEGTQGAAMTRGAAGPWFMGPSWSAQPPSSC